MTPEQDNDTKGTYRSLSGMDHGGAIPKTGPTNPFRGENPDLQETRSLTSNLGRICERTLIGVLDNSLNLQASSQLDDALRQTLLEARVAAGDTILPLARKNRHPELSDPLPQVTDREKRYFQIFEPTVVLCEDETFPSLEIAQPKNRAVLTLFEELDQLDEALKITSFLGDSLAGTYDSIFKVGGMYFLDDTMRIDRGRHLIEAAIILAKTICRQDQIKEIVPGQIVPQSKAKIPGVVEFDGLRIIGRSQIPEDFTLDTFLDSENPRWAVIEVKTVLIYRQSTGPAKLKEVRNYDYNAVREQLGKLVVWWSREHPQTPFPFPDSITFVYLRGDLNNLTHSVYLNERFFEKWAEGINQRFESGLSDLEELDRLGITTLLYDQISLAKAAQKDKWRKGARERKKAAIDFQKALREGKPTQGILFFSS